MILPGRGNGRFRFLAAVLILLAAGVSLYGKGSGDSSYLSHADDLIESKYYDEAIRFLTDYLKTNPDSIGDAQMRLQTIFRLRERYNEVANELLDTLQNNPDDSEKILKLSNELLTIESPTNPSVGRFLDQIRFLAELNVNRHRLQALLKAGGEQLEQNNFSGALATYASGLDIYQREYFTSGYGQEAEDVAATGLEIIRQNIQDFNDLRAPFSIAARALTDLNGFELPDVEKLRQAYMDLLPLMDEIIAIQKGFADTRGSFSDQLLIHQSADDTLGDRSFLAFAVWLISGPVDRNEGMIGAIDRFWHLYIDPSGTALITFVDRSYVAGYSAMVNRDFTNGLLAFDTTSRYISFALEMLDSSDTFIHTDSIRSFSLSKDTVSEEKIEEYLKLKTMNQAVAFLIETGNFGVKASVFENELQPALYSWQQGTMGTQEAVSQEENYRVSYREIINGLNDIVERISAEAEEVSRDYNSLPEAADISANFQSYLTDSRNLAMTLGNRVRNLDLQSAIRLYTIANGDLEKKVREREAEFNEADSLIKGIPRISEGMEVSIALYPAEGLAVLDRMTQNLGPAVNEARALLSRYNEEDERVINAPEVIRFYASAQDYLARLLRLQTQSGALIVSARTQMERAASLKFEGDRLLQAAQTALNQNNFDSARNYLSRAADQYQASLAIQESSSIRTTWDTQFVKLGEDIVRNENEIVVRDVRNLVTTARDRYYAGNMEQAEDLLIRAQSRWRVTNITEQLEVEYWLSLVRGALSLQSGRTIAPTAPLYAEVSQLLSEAKRNYDEGTRFLAGGMRQQGLAKFNEAMVKTREVRLMFPMNHEARMLELMIEQQTDTAVFNSVFQQRLNEAVAGTKPNVRSIQSFADLQDLAEINPRYPGLQAILVQAEIDMGIRPPPPNPADLARSSELTRSAQAYINSMDTVRYGVAQTQLEEAIRLDPNNTRAQTLLDQVSVLMTGTGRIVLSSAAQDQYDVAIRMYNQGNYLRANAIVEQLLQNPQNQKSTLIIELKRRIDAVL